MKKFFAIAAAVLISVASFAQETNIDENGNYKYGPYETNAFTDNMFWGLGIGGNSIWNWTNGPKIPFVSMPGLAVEGYVGKWFTPGVGARVGYYGLTQNVFNQGQHVLAADLMWNFSNSVYGYSETRKWFWAPYLRAGLEMYCNNGLAAGTNREWVLGFGSMLIHPLNDKLNLTIDNPILVTKTTESSQNAVVTNEGKAKQILSMFSFPFSVMVGLQWNIGKTNWTRTATTAAAAAAAIAAANEAANKAKADAQKTADEAQAAAKNAQNEAKQLVDEAKKAAGSNIDGLFDEPVVVYFQIGQSTLSKAEKAHAEYAIKNIIARGENVKFTLNGSADTGTGSKARNKQLSKQRAQTVYNLVDELGVSRENITVVEWDGTERFATPELNRAVIIEKQ